MIQRYKKSIEIKLLNIYNKKSENNCRGRRQMEILVVKADPEADFDSYCGRFVKYISTERRERVERMRSERDRITSVLAELTVRIQIILHTGMKNEDIRFDYGEHGKPFLHGREDFQFSFSHAGGYVAFVCGKRSVGVDIERTDREKENIARKHFTENEYEAIYTRRKKTFAEIWTAKEAYVKYLGTGLSKGLNTFDVLDDSTGCRFVSFDIPGGYTATVCLDTDDEVTCRVITADEVFEQYN